MRAEDGVTLTTPVMATEQARAQVCGAIEAYITDVDPGMTYVGKVHELWLDAVEGYISARAVGMGIGRTESLQKCLGAERGGRARAVDRLEDILEADFALRSGWMKQGRYYVWCPPSHRDATGVRWPTRYAQREISGVPGYTVDTGREQDLEAVSPFERVGRP